MPEVRTTHTTGDLSREPAVRRGRPSRDEAEKLAEHILQVATELFLAQGYGATSIEAIAQQAGTSKRTFYHRFTDKADLFAAVVHRLILRLRPQNPQKEAELFIGNSLHELLRGLGRVILNATLQPEALGLHKILISEATRFPELTSVLEREGSRQEAISRIGAVFKAQGKTAVDPYFAAEQFMHMLISVPQQRALGMGKPMTQEELDQWLDRTVDLFLYGILRG